MWSVLRPLCVVLSVVAAGLAYGVGESASHKVIANSLGMKFVWIPPGSFQMGSANDEHDREHDEHPHKVTLSRGFYMAACPVTQEEWQKVTGKNPGKFRGRKDLPVENVNWPDCQEFIKTLKDQDRRPYRLPTEAEWEYACRAGTTTPFYCGATISTDQANYNGNYVYGNGTKGVYREKTVAVGSFPPNAWGLYDMHGNVAQWCQDMLNEYPRRDVVDPLNTFGENRVLRGGSWIDSPRDCRSAFRGGSRPELRHSMVGLRLCFDKE